MRCAHGDMDDCGYPSEKIVYKLEFTDVVRASWDRMPYEWKSLASCGWRESCLHCSFDRSCNCAFAFFVFSFQHWASQRRRRRLWRLCVPFNRKALEWSHGIHMVVGMCAIIVLSIAVPAMAMVSANDEDDNDNEDVKTHNINCT